MAFLIGFIFAALGVALDHHQIITEPAYWALFGAVFGALGVIIAR